MTDATRVIRDLRELAALTSDDQGAQRVAWSPVWQRARAWFAEKLAAIGHAGRARRGRQLLGDGRPAVRRRPSSSARTSIQFRTADGSTARSGVLAALEALRVYGTRDLPVTLRLVDWADEEGRFGMSLLGSSAAAGRIDLDAARAARDRNGVPLVDALRDHGLERRRAAGRASAPAGPSTGGPYLELHIEQGPVLASLGAPAGAVVGTFGVERHMLRFVGQAAHAGSTPLPLRRDAFLAAAQTAVECREAARRLGEGGAPVVCTTGFVSVQPNIPTAIAGACEMSLDLRSLDASALAAMLGEAQTAADRCAAANQVSVEWRRLWRIEPRAFDTALVAAVRGSRPRGNRPGAAPAVRARFTTRRRWRR